MLADNKRKNISILGKGPSQGLDDATLNVENNILYILLTIIRNLVKFEL